MSALARPVPDELDRILALPRREPLDCERQVGPDGRPVRRWSPQAQALVELVTAQFTRGPRIACACRDRRVVGAPNGRLLVYQSPPPGLPPAPPVETDVEAFCRDNAHDPPAVEKVRAIRWGQTVDLPGLGYPFCVTELNPVQAWVLYEAPRAGGILGMLSVGSGKTFTSLLTPLSMPNLRRWVLLIKPDQRLHYRRAYLRLREHFRVPTVVHDTRDPRDSFWVEGAPVVHVVPYSTLSNPKSTQLLDLYDPDGVVADEGHLLASKVSSRTLRFLRFMGRRNEQNRPVAFFDWSGSVVKKSIKDVAHLSALALGYGSPLPISSDEVERLAAVVDPQIMPDRDSPTAKKLQVVFGGGLRRGVGVVLDSAAEIRRGLRDRIVQTPGVISTRSSGASCSITIREREAPPIPASVREALAGVRAHSTRPDGEELVEAPEIARAAHTVAAGFYHYWAFPKARPEDLADGGLVDQWFAARKAFNKELRAKILCGEPHLDSRVLCENAAERAWQSPKYEGDLPTWPSDTWPAWAAIMDRVEYDERVRWIDDYLARDAAEWAKKNVGIVWCQSRAFGQRVAQLAGINYHGGGADAEERILAEDGRRSIVASVRAHGTGRDGLQLKFCKQLLPPDIPLASGDQYEQVLGRLAREGQVADTVEAEIYLHTSELRASLRQAVMYAEFIETTTPNRQLLLAADRAGLAGTV